MMYQIFNEGELVDYYATAKDVRDFFIQIRTDWIRDARDYPEAYSDDPAKEFDEYVRDVYRVLSVQDIELFL